MQTDTMTTTTLGIVTTTKSMHIPRSSELGPGRKCMQNGTWSAMGFTLQLLDLVPTHCNGL